MQRDVLPVPDVPPEGLTTCDAKDPDNSARTFTGIVDWVEVDVGEDDHNHNRLIRPEDRVQPAVGFQ